MESESRVSRPRTGRLSAVILAELPQAFAFAAWIVWPSQAAPSPRAFAPGPTFVDVPLNRPFYPYPEALFQVGQTIQVAGKIILYQGHPELPFGSPDQMEVLP